MSALGGQNRVRPPWAKPCPPSVGADLCVCPYHPPTPHPTTDGQPRPADFHIAGDTVRVARRSGLGADAWTKASPRRQSKPTGGSPQYGRNCTPGARRPPMRRNPTPRAPGCPAGAGQRSRTRRHCRPRRRAARSDRWPMNVGIEEGLLRIVKSLSQTIATPSSQTATTRAQTAVRPPSQSAELPPHAPTICGIKMIGRQRSRVE